MPNYNNANYSAYSFRTKLAKNTSREKIILYILSTVSASPFSIAVIAGSPEFSYLCAAFLKSIQ